MSTQPIGPADYSKTPRFAGPPTFGLLPRIDEVEAQRPGEKIDVKILGVPFDAGVSYRPGARFGPAHIRQSSKLLRPYNQATNVHAFTWQQVADCGDLGVNPFDIEEAITEVERTADEMRADGAKLLTLGGDHTLALPNLRSLHKTHGKIAVLHFDAHLDTWDTYFGAPYTHGTPFRRASEEGLLDLESCMHVGIRGPLYGEKDLEDDAVLGFQIIRSDDYQFTSVQEVVARMRRRLGDAPVYLSVDIDVLDPAAAPGTGTPEAGGMTSRELLNSIRGLQGLNVVGAEIVEVAPAYDHAEITGLAAAHVGYEMLSLWAAEANGLTGPSGPSGEALGV
ncbi:agmatinase [Brevibacterium sp. RIT 803]|jgi:agmatinase|uniref:agmatinase n=1 Tax=Brevibacterium sp. RIT 803 TaxID=2810210 RepID=UPI00194E790A|nr:agmatinase [Brevibacterium sp. RIT 803]MBM6588835.1 agmatinase [Brevibacterium sp. RIT 803]